MYKTVTSFLPHFAARPPLALVCRKLQLPPTPNYWRKNTQKILRGFQGFLSQCFYGKWRWNISGSWSSFSRHFCGNICAPYSHHWPWVLAANLFWVSKSTREYFRFLWDRDTVIFSKTFLISVFLLPCSKGTCSHGFPVFSCENKCFLCPVMWYNVYKIRQPNLLQWNNTCSFI